MKEGSFLKILATVVIVAIGILFILGNTLGIPLAPKPTPTTDTQTKALLEQKTSDDAADIEKDLEDTDLSNLDQELGDIDKELSTY